MSCDLTAQPPLEIFEFCFEILARRIGTLTYGYPTPPVSVDSAAMQPRTRGHSLYAWKSGHTQAACLCVDCLVINESRAGVEEKSDAVQAGCFCLCVFFFCFVAQKPTIGHVQKLLPCSYLFYHLLYCNFCCWVLALFRRGVEPWEEANTHTHACTHQYQY